MTSEARRRAYGLVVAGAFSYTCLLFVWFTLPAYLSTIIEEVGLTGTEAGLLAGAVPLTYIPLALFSGLAVDRIGPARSLATGLVVFGVAQIARSVAGGFPTLLAATVGIGVGATAITFGLPKLVAVLFPPEETGLPSSLYLVGSSAGTAAAFGLGRPVLGPALGGWRPLFLWSGVVAVGYAVVWLALARLAGLTGRETEDDAAFTPGSITADARAVLAHRELRLVVLVGVTYLLVIHGLQGWLPTILEARGLSPGRAGQTTTLLVGANVVGILAIPALADRFDARRLAITACGLVAFAGVVGVVTGGATLLAAAGIVGAGLGVGGLSPLVRAIPPELEGIGPGLTGAAVGLVFAVGEVGGFLGPVTVGVLHDLTGSYVPGLAVLACGGIVAAFAGVGMRR
ncbi:MFS transporter [Halorientalis litorea]|uniref:MFS transporter n=1 Tax=Halorientalis litorea TaxID=2931977 RepID=UPI001FF3ADFE|nr:MFS transporter [Halorientalis litorea]